MTLLDGVVIATRRETPATATCARHLVRLGASVGSSREAAVVLEGEEHELMGGGLVASETTAQAALGLTDYIGPFGGHPARTGCDLASAAAGYCGALVTLARLRGSERPVRVELSPLRSLAALKTIIWAARTRPDEWSGTHVRSRERLVDSGYETQDGRVTLDFPFDGFEQWRSFVGALGLPTSTVGLFEPRWYETVGWGDDVDEGRPHYESRLREFSTAQAISMIREHGGSSVPFLTAEECLSHPQSEALGLRDRVETGLPWSLDGRPGAITATRPVDAHYPLEGLRVLDFGVGGVGPFSATLLAWLGADVIKIEAPNEFIHAVRPTSNGISTTYLAINQGKRSVRLDLKHEPDRELAKKLVRTADVVMENFRPGAMGRLGLGFDDVRALNPRVVYCSVTGFGSHGPLSAELCTDPHMQAFSGFAAENADTRDGRPRRVRYYAIVDLVTSCAVAEAACAGLLLRDAGGEAVRVETSMLQVMADVIGGTRRARPFPDGIFGAADGHVALTCDDDAGWRTLVDALGSDALRARAGLGRRRSPRRPRRDRARARRRVAAAPGRGVGPSPRPGRDPLRARRARRGSDGAPGSLGRGRAPRPPASVRASDRGRAALACSRGRHAPGGSASWGAHGAHPRRGRACLVRVTSTRPRSERRIDVAVPTTP